MKMRILRNSVINKRYLNDNKKYEYKFKYLNVLINFKNKILVQQVKNLFFLIKSKKNYLVIICKNPIISNI